MSSSTSNPNPPPPEPERHHVPTASRSALKPYLPQFPPPHPPLSSSHSSPSLASSQTTPNNNQPKSKPSQPKPTPIPSPLPHLTLTYAQSLDGMISLGQNLQTYLSGSASKAMTHYLRSVHDAILVGAGTVCVDDPGLNSRFGEGGGDGGGEGFEGGGGFEGGEIVGLERQPRPVILDPGRKWRAGGSKVVRIAREGRGRGPWWIVLGEKERGGERGEDEDEDIKAIREVGGDIIFISPLTLENKTPQPSSTPHTPTFLPWPAILSALATRGTKSLMVEGGATIINGLYKPENRRFISSIIVTVAPKYLGEGGVVVCPRREEVGRSAVELRDVVWVPLGRDGVMAARIEGGGGGD